MCEEFFNKPEYVLNKIYLRYIGVWPYEQTSSISLFLRIVITATLVMCIAPQLLKGYEKFSDNIDEALQVLPSTGIAVGTIIKYWNALTNMKEMKILLDQVKRDYEALVKLPQRVLMETGSMHGRRITIFYTLFILVCGSFYSFIPILPVLLDILKPLNDSRERQFMFEIEIYIDNEAHYCTVMIIEYLEAFLVTCILIALDTMYMVYVQHACTLFTITSYQIKYAYILEDCYVVEEKAEYQGSVDLNKTYTELECKEIYQKLKLGIRLHSNAIIYCQLLVTGFSTALAFQLLSIISCFSFTGFAIYINLGNPNELLRYIALVLAQVAHLFFICLPGQMIINYSERVHVDAYASKWYMFPIKIKKLFKFVLLRTAEPCTLTAAKITIINMETFLNITKTAMSYFTVLSSMR